MKHKKVILTNDYIKALSFISNPTIKAFTQEALEYYTPLCFWEIPGSFSQFYHNEDEHAIGVLADNGETYRINSLGGKAWHTLRVVNIAKTIMDSDKKEILTSTNKVKGIFEGNELPSDLYDCCIAACLLHDIYSLSYGREWRDLKPRKMDNMHPFYHRERLVECANNTNLSKKLFSIIITCIESHMWKWSPPEKHDLIPRRNNAKNMDTLEKYRMFMEIYRIIEYVHIADLIAAQKEFKGFKE